MPPKKSLKNQFPNRKHFLKSQLKYLNKYSRGNLEKNKIRLDKFQGFIKEASKFIIEDPRLSKYISSKKYKQEKKVEYISNYILKKNLGNFKLAKKELTEISRGLDNRSKSYTKFLNKYVSINFKNKTQKERREIKRQLKHDFSNYIAILKTYILFSRMRLEEIKKTRIHK